MPNLPYNVRLAFPNRDAAVAFLRDRDLVASSVTAVEILDDTAAAQLASAASDLRGVMEAVDKWFEDNDPRRQENPATRAAAAREIALQAIDRAERARDESQRALVRSKTFSDEIVKEFGKHGLAAGPTALARVVEERDLALLRLKALGCEVSATADAAVPVPTSSAPSTADLNAAMDRIKQRVDGIRADLKAITDVTASLTK